MILPPRFDIIKRKLIISAASTPSNLLNMPNIIPIPNIPEERKVSLELLKAIELDNCKLSGPIYDITGDPLLDQSALKRMNKEVDFLHLALYDNINCLEYFARYKESIDKLFMVFGALVRHSHSNVSPIEKTNRFMKAYGLEVNTLMRHVNLFDVPVFYLVCMWTSDKNIILDLLEQNPNLNAKVILRDGSKEEIVANNIDEFFNFFSSPDSLENIASSKEVLNVKLLKDGLSLALSPALNNKHTHNIKYKI